MATLVPMARGEPWPVWPLPGVGKGVPTTGGRRFGANRTGKTGPRFHAGVDIFAPEGALVVAPEAGELVRQYKFNGAQAFALLLQADSGPVFNLAEVFPGSWREFGLTVGTRTTSGSWVDKGESIARIGVNPGGSTMLHFESYTSGTRANQRWFRNQDPPRRLLDPTHYLLLAAGQDAIPDDPIIPPLDPIDPPGDSSEGARVAIIAASALGFALLGGLLLRKRKR